MPNNLLYFQLTANNTILDMYTSNSTTYFTAPSSRDLCAEMLCSNNKKLISLFCSLEVNLFYFIYLFKSQMKYRRYGKHDAMPVAKCFGSWYESNCCKNNNVQLSVPEFAEELQLMSEASGVMKVWLSSSLPQPGWWRASKCHCCWYCCLLPLMGNSGHIRGGAILEKLLCIRDRLWKVVEVIQIHQ